MEPILVSLHPHPIMSGVLSRPFCRHVRRSIMSILSSCPASCHVIPALSSCPASCHGLSSIIVDKRRSPASSKNGLHRGVRGTARSSVENPINFNRRQPCHVSPSVVMPGVLSCPFCRHVRRPVTSFPRRRESPLFVGAATPRWFSPVYLGAGVPLNADRTQTARFPPSRE